MFHQLICRYVECTSSLIQALILFNGIYPSYRHEEIEKNIKSGALLIEKQQRKDGSWYKKYQSWFFASYILYTIIQTNIIGTDLGLYALHMLLSSL